MFPAGFGNVTAREGDCDAARQSFQSGLKRSILRVISLASRQFFPVGMRLPELGHIGLIAPAFVMLRARLFPGWVKIIIGMTGLVSSRLDPVPAGALNPCQNFFR
ncbi:MAG: hypothetical protein CMO10_14215 [Thalassospira sp.]|nr:hypothetical protein [Thalassospira sp.]